MSDFNEFNDLGEHVAQGIELIAQAIAHAHENGKIHDINSIRAELSLLTLDVNALGREAGANPCKVYLVIDTDEERAAQLTEAQVRITQRDNAFVLNLDSVRGYECDCEGCIQRRQDEELSRSLGSPEQAAEMAKKIIRGSN